MQMNFDSASLASRAIAMPAPTTVPRLEAARLHGLAGDPPHPLSEARQEALRSDASENMVWLAVVLCAAAVLALSFLGY